ncbi:unnamed protein product [Amoebophrya sp. A120]|nr:unnamed protein product [Amoebophrya sp. A120]|eukprot:GSA120T00009275001.1
MRLSPPRHLPAPGVLLRCAVKLVKLLFTCSATLSSLKTGYALNLVSRSIFSSSSSSWFPLFPDRQEDASHVQEGGGVPAQEETTQNDVVSSKPPAVPSSPVPGQGEEDETFLCDILNMITDHDNTSSDLACSPALTPSSRNILLPPKRSRDEEAEDRSPDTTHRRRHDNCREDEIASQEFGNPRGTASIRDNEFVREREVDPDRFQLAENKTENKSKEKIQPEDTTWVLVEIFNAAGDKIVYNDQEGRNKSLVVQNLFPKSHLVIGGADDWEDRQRGTGTSEFVKNSNDWPLYKVHDAVTGLLGTTASSDHATTTFGMRQTTSRDGGYNWHLLTFPSPPRRSCSTTKVTNHDATRAARFISTSEDVESPGVLTQEPPPPKKLSPNTRFFRRSSTCSKEEYNDVQERTRPTGPSNYGAAPELLISRGGPLARRPGVSVLLAEEVLDQLLVPVNVATVAEEDQKYLLRNCSERNNRPSSSTSSAQLCSTVSPAAAVRRHASRRRHCNSVWCAGKEARHAPPPPPKSPVPDREPSPSVYRGAGKVSKRGSA